MTRKKRPVDTDRLERVVATARRSRQERERGYREQALRLFPWICARCAREFTRANVHELTVHHKDHDHDNNPADGSNWELLCLYCHDNEHQRELEAGNASGTPAEERSAGVAGDRYRPFAELEKLLKRR